MANHKLSVMSVEEPKPGHTQLWLFVQVLVWFTGAFIIFNLIVYPTIGINIFWNILVPILPAVLVLAIGVWRNVCPMASTTLFSSHLGLSKRRKITVSQSGKLNLIAVIALFIIVPLRHAIFNTNGQATALLIISLGLTGAIAGLFYDWKSAWCSGLCPIYPVEKLYAIGNKLSITNAHCHKCYSCIIPCPDSTPGINPLSLEKKAYHNMAGVLLAGGFPGFIWGWFQVPDYAGITGIEQLVSIYKLPLAGLLVTMVLFTVLKQFVGKNVLMAIFSAAAVSCYYWFRLPELFGFGIYPGDGMLVDLSGVLPEWIVYVVVLVIIVFFYWWFIYHKQTKSWLIRPDYVNKKNDLLHKHKTAAIIDKDQ